MTDARIDPATRTMIDNLAAKTGRSLDEWVAVVRAEGLDKSDHGGTRLVPTTGRCTHLVRISGADELDAELEGWLQAAYKQA